MSYWCQIDRPNTSLIDQITLCDIIFKAYYTTTTEEPFAEKSVEDIVFDKNVVKVVIADIENAAPETDDDDDVDDDCAVTLRTGGHEIEDGGYVRAFFGELTQVRSWDWRRGLRQGFLWWTNTGTVMRLKTGATSGLSLVNLHRYREQKTSLLFPHIVG